MSETFYYASNDAMFKRIFADERDIEPLVAFLQAALDLPPEDYEEVSLVDPILAREHPEGKLGILDVSEVIGLWAARLLPAVWGLPAQGGHLRPARRVPPAGYALPRQAGAKTRLSTLPYYRDRLKSCDFSIT